jgi:hypothetical protein
MMMLPSKHHLVSSFVSKEYNAYILLSLLFALFCSLRLAYPTNALYGLLVHKCVSIGLFGDSCHVIFYRNESDCKIQELFLMKNKLMTESAFRLFSSKNRVTFHTRSYFDFFFRLVYITMPAETRNSAPLTQNTTTMYQITSENPDGEYTDQELLSLVNYFEISRLELQNV